MRRKVEIAMRRKETVRKAVLCVAVAAAMFVGVAIPRVYAADYSEGNVNVNETVVFPGKTLDCTDATIIVYRDDTGKSMKEVTIESGQADYTVLTCEEAVLGSDYTIPVGMVFDGWKIIEVPGTSGGQWTLQLCLKGERNVISTVGSWKLEEGEEYHLQGGITHVDGDPTTYANPITFTVSQTKSYTFK